MKKSAQLFVVCFLVFSQAVLAQGISNVRLLGGGNVICARYSKTVQFDTAGIGGGSFQVQVSASNGSFVTPVFTQNSSLTSVPITLPASVSSGNTYAIRVVRLSPSLLYSDTLKNLQISSPQANFSFSPNNACPATPVAFSNSSSGSGTLSYAWTFNNTYTFGAPSASTLAEPNVQFNPFFGGGTISYRAKLRITDALGCVDSMQADVQVRQRPLAALQDSNLFAYPAFSNCSGAPSSTNPNFRLTVNNLCEVKSTIANIQINWGQGAPQNFAGTFAQASHVYTALGAYNLVITAQNNNGCVSTQNYTVSNQVSPTIALGGPDNKQGCAPFKYPFVLSNYSTNNPGTYYEIDFNDGSPKLRIETLNNDTVWHTFATNSCSKPGGFFLVRATAYNSCDSASATLGNFRVWTKPSANFNITPGSSICGGDTAFFTNTTTAAQYGVSCANTTLYNWQFTGGSLSSSSLVTPPPVIYNAGGVYPVRLIATNPCGSDTVIKQICVQAAPVANFSYAFSPAVACKDNRLVLQDISSTTTACGASNISWSLRDSASNVLLQEGIHYDYVVGKADSTYAEILFKQKGTYKLNLFIQNACGTDDIDSVIRINDITRVQFAADTVVYCDSAVIAFNAMPAHSLSYDSSFAQAMSYVWSISPSNYTLVQGTLGSRNPQIKFANTDTLPKIFRIIHSANNLCGSGVPDTQYVVINPKPRVFVNVLNPLICSGTQAQITLSSSIIGGVNYTWRAYSNNPQISGYSSQTTPGAGLITQTLLNNSATTDTVFYKMVAIQPSNSCQGDSSAPATVLVQSAISNNVLSKSPPICAGDSAPVISGSVAQGGNGAYRFRWQKWDGSTWQYTSAADTLASYWPGYPSSTQLYRREIRSQNCLASPPSFSNVDTLLVRLKPIVDVGSDRNSCTNHAPLVLHGNPGGGIWSGTSLQGSNGFNPAAAGLGLHSLVYVYTDTFGCWGRDTL
ncbi:MAG: hypothetical protein MH472_09880, partial [Bacteroidia bacterium]|nr:hypothetical protein [Bacteroidia bacterium]